MQTLTRNTTCGSAAWYQLTDLRNKRTGSSTNNHQQLENHWRESEVAIRQSLQKPEPISKLTGSGF